MAHWQELLDAPAHYLNADAAEMISTHDGPGVRKLH
jgi:hypothetical protein